MDLANLVFNVFLVYLFFFVFLVFAIRKEFLWKCSNCMKSIVMQYGVSSIQSSFSLMIADRNNWQTQLFSLGPILNTNLYTLGFGLTSCPLIKLNKLSLERICDPLTIMIRALFA